MPGRRFRIYSREFKEAAVRRILAGEKIPAVAKQLRLGKLLYSWRDLYEQGGVDALVFCAGIGERSVEIRRRICEASGWLGVALDGDANARHGPRISPAGSRPSAWVIPTNEELMIARHTSALLELGEVQA